MALYEVTGGKLPHIIGPRLIEAKTKTQALAYATETWLKVEKCSGSRAHTLASRGVELEYAPGNEPATPAEPEPNGDA